MDKRQVEQALNRDGGNYQDKPDVLLMTTDPGDLVFDPTCGSGTTAYVAEKWGRRWITCDTSRVAVTLAKQRLMTAGFDYYKLKSPNEGVSSGFQYKTVPHIRVYRFEGSIMIANNKARVTGPFTEPPITKSLSNMKAG